jgi:methylmalonyl-CoA mutase
MAERHRPLAQLVTALETAKRLPSCAARSSTLPTFCACRCSARYGSRKSSLTDELIRRIRLDQNDRLNIAVILRRSRRAASPVASGDRIRTKSRRGMASPASTRSFATREAG